MKKLISKIGKRVSNFKFKNYKTIANRKPNFKLKNYKKRCTLSQFTYYLCQVKTYFSKRYSIRSTQMFMQGNKFCAENLT